MQEAYHVPDERDVIKLIARSLTVILFSVQQFLDHILRPFNRQSVRFLIPFFGSFKPIRGHRPFAFDINRTTQSDVEKARGC